MSDDPGDGRFPEQHVRTLDRVLDEIIPPSEDGRLPGAGEIGLVQHIEAALRPMPELRVMIEQSLAALDDLARQRHDRPFAALAKAERAALVKELESTHHALPPILTMYVYTGYYMHPRVLETLGLEARPPHPKGFDMPPNDLSLLDPVRARGKRYRD